MLSVRNREGRGTRDNRRKACRRTPDRASLRTLRYVFYLFKLRLRYFYCQISFLINHRLGHCLSNFLLSFTSVNLRNNAVCLTIRAFMTAHNIRYNYWVIKSRAAPAPHRRRPRAAGPRFTVSPAAAERCRQNKSIQKRRFVVACRGKNLLGALIFRSYINYTNKVLRLNRGKG